MATYRYRCDSDEFHSVAMRSKAMRDRLFSADLDIATLAKRPIPVVVEEDGKPGDFYSSLPHLVVMTARAAEALRGLIDDEGRFLTLDVRASYPVSLTMFVPKAIPDCLDEEKSIIRRVGDVIVSVKRLVFRKEAISRHHCFRIKHFELSAVILSQAFIDVVEAQKLRGLLPIKLDDEFG